MMERKTHTIDAVDKILGRLAAQVAVLLRGKNKPNFAPNKDIGDFVVIKNIEKVRVSGKKMEQKKYFHHSGYLGGLKEVPFKTLFKERPEEVFRKAVFGMLPRNKLRAEQIKRLKFA
jgi:large subunit ribosomal protein L13